MKHASRRITWVAFAINFIVFSENFVIAPFLQRLAEVTGSTAVTTAQLVLVYTLSIGFGALLIGPLGDRFGRRTLLLWGLLAFTLTTAGTGLAQGMGQLMVLRALCGLSAGVLLSNLMAYMADIFLAEGRIDEMPGAMSKAMGGIFTAIVFGVPAGIYAGYVADWWLSFFVLGFLAAVVFADLATGLPKLPGSASQMPYGTLVFSGFALFAERRMFLIGASFFLFQVIATGFGTYAPIWILAHGFQLDTLALVYAGTGAVSVLMAMRAGAIIRVLGLPMTLFCANTLIVVMLLALFGAPFSLPLLGGAMAAYLSALAIRMGLLQAVATSTIDRAMRGRFMALNNFLMQMGSSAGVWAVGQVMLAIPDPDAGFRTATALLAGVGLATVLIGLALMPPFRQARKEAA
jgi:MFS transporter, DHA1 family, inner membrane transport protein